MRIFSPERMKDSQEEGGMRPCVASLLSVTLTLTIPAGSPLSPAVLSLAKEDVGQLQTQLREPGRAD